MKKFKLIKEYPGGPKLGTVCEEINNKLSFCYYFEGEKNIGISKDQVENQPEFWEEIEKVITELVVFTKNNLTTTELWNPVLVKRFNTDIKYIDNVSCFGFKTREEADEFILYNKPCLSFSEVRGLVGYNFFGSTSHEKLFELVKSRI